MSIDTNDIKILVHSSLQLLMKSCWQCVKDHPIVSVFLLVFLSFYIFMPSLFNLLFYTSPLVICTAILLLQGRFHFIHQYIRANKFDDENEKAIVEAHSSAREFVTPRRKLRPTIQAAMSRRTFKKRTCEELGTILMEDLKVDFIIRSFSDEMPMKLRDEKVSYGSDDSVSSWQLEKPSDDKKEEEPEDKPSESVNIDVPQKSSNCEVSDPDAESPKEDNPEAEMEKEKENQNPAVEWNEEAQKSHMDLGSSDINKRLENLIAKRRARKMFSMLPHRNPMNSVVVANEFQGHVTPVLTERNNNSNNSDNEGGQPGSAPSLLLPKNPFDIPYDPSEEKPVLTSDGFEEEILITQPKDMHFCRHESFQYGPSFCAEHFEDSPLKSRSSVFSNPIESIGPGLPRFRRHSDGGEHVKHEPKLPTQKSENLNQIHEHLSNKAQLENIQTNNHHEEANIVTPNLPSSHEENVAPEGEYGDTVSLESRDAINEQVINSEQEETRNNTSAMNQDSTEDENDETSSSSSFEASTADTASASADITVAVKNETFRNSVKKVLAVIQKNRSNIGRERDIPPPSRTSTIDSSDDNALSYVHPSKMEDWSFYSRPSHHLSYSIASDMQVEVSEGPTSPTDVESLVFDRDEDDQDEDNTDEDSQGISRDSIRSKGQLFVDNSHDTNTDSSNAEDQSVEASNMLSMDVDDGHQECASQEIDYGSIQSPNGSTSSVTQVTKDSDSFLTQRFQDLNTAQMLGSASTSTGQNIDNYYIHLPSDDLPNQDPQSYQASISPSDSEAADLTSTPTSVLQDTVTINDEDSVNNQNSASPFSPSTADYRGSVAGSTASPKSVLPETIPAHEFASSWECSSSSVDHQRATTNEGLGGQPALVAPSSSVAPHTIPIDEMAGRSNESVNSIIQPIDGVEDEVCQETPISLEKDPSEEKLHERRPEEAVMVPTIPAKAQNQTTS